MENIEIARSVSDLPILRKDFIMDAREVVQTKRIGANMMLLIVAMLEDAVSLETTKRLASRIPADISIVSESGIFTHEDMEYVRKAGADAVLIGESFMRCPDIRTHLQELKYGSCKAVRY